MKKKSQSGMNAAVLVAIIGALIIIFVLFSSTEEREKFLNESGKRSTRTSRTGLNITVLLLEHPGRMLHFTKNEIEHEIPSVNLYARTDSKILKTVESLYIKNSVFDKQEQSVAFSVANPKNIGNALLSFNTALRKGRLMISVNGNEIFNQEIKTASINPIAIPSEYLLNDNFINFKVSGVGFKFWASNEYSLEKIKITADITDVSTQASETVFLVEEEEADNVDKAELMFVPECDIGEVGKLDIFINTYNIYSAVPDCGVAYPLEFSPAYLTEGENRLLFKSQMGNYLIDRISVRAKLKETPSYIYTFDVSKEQLDDIRSGDFDINITFRFFDDVEEKFADIYVNAHKMAMPRTTSSVFSRKINNQVERGVNSLKIIPKTTLEVDDLEVAIYELED